jgi:hypothetical protein
VREWIAPKLPESQPHLAFANVQLIRRRKLQSVTCHDNFRIWRTDFYFLDSHCEQRSMKHAEAKRLIAAEWDRWVQAQSIHPKRASARDCFKFFLELQDARSPLLDFQTRGRDKWQIVHAWLLGDRRVT